MALQIVERVRPRCDRAFVRRVVRTTLAFARCDGQPVSLLLTDDAEIARIHAEFLDDASVTDVISFPGDADDPAEIVVNVAMARRVARARGHAARAELALYIVHGLLHCCGFDDMQVRARRRMRVAEREVLAELGLRVSAVD